MKHLVSTLFALLVLLGSPGDVWGQSLALSSATIAFPAAGVAQLNAGGVAHPAILVSIEADSTTGWQLVLRSSDLALGASGKPLSDLEWRMEGSSTWTPVTTVDQAVATGIGDATLGVHFRTRLGWAKDKPGSYAADLTFSLTTIG